MACVVHGVQTEQYFDPQQQLRQVRLETISTCCLGMHRLDCTAMHGAWST